MRIVFLLGGFLLYTLGTAAAAQMENAVNWVAYLLGQVVVLSIQLMAHYLNEYYDLEVDRQTGDNRTWFYSAPPISLRLPAPTTFL